MRMIAFFISMLVLSQSMNFHLSDFAKVGELLSHAELHQDEYGDDWLTFLSKHYGALKMQHEEQKPSNHQQHDDLPFHCDHQFSSLHIVTPERAKIFLKRPKFIQQKVMNTFYNSLYNSPSLSTIVQPPQEI